MENSNLNTKNRVLQYNSKILKECREQISIPLEKVKKRVPFVEEMEKGEVAPTFKQLDTFAELYHVPRWVFISDTLPDEYNFEKRLPQFRKLKNSPLALDETSHKAIKGVMVEVEQLRSLILELEEELEQNTKKFDPPAITENPEEAARTIREWLGCEDGKSLSFFEWKERIEKKGVFVFLTSKYIGSSHIDRELFRGFCIHYPLLPIIVINYSDAQKALSFTLFHELSHLLRKESSTDAWKNSEPSNEETLCDKIAGATLMPEKLLPPPFSDLPSLKNTAKKFNVSPYACLVRYYSLDLIDIKLYNQLEKELKQEWEKSQKKQKEKSGGKRNRVKEIKEQYGLYRKVILNAYSENIINLYNSMEIFKIKNPSYISRLMEES